jgi:hypothetical protein
MAVQLNALSCPCRVCAMRKVQPFVTMQWQYNQLSNNGNLAIYLSILGRDIARSILQRFYVRKIPRVVVEIIHFCSHALHFSTSFPLYFSHSSHTLCMVPFQHRMSYALFYPFFWLARKKNLSWWDLIFFCSLVCFISGQYVCKMHLWLFFRKIHLVLKKEEFSDDDGMRHVGFHYPLHHRAMRFLHCIVHIERAHRNCAKKIKRWKTS